MLYGFLYPRYNKVFGIILILFFFSEEACSSAKGAQKTLLIIGDSLVQGFGLPQEDGFVRQLNKKLIDDGMKVHLVNGGVSGDTTAGGLARLDWSITNEIDAVVVSLGANDMLRGLPPKHSKSNLTKIIQKLRDRNLPILLVGIKSIGNYGSDYKTKFDNIYYDLAKEFDLLLYPDLLSPILNKENVNLADYYQSDKLHPNAAGVHLMVEGIKPFLADLIELIISED